MAGALASYREVRMATPWRVHEWAASMHEAVDKGILSGDKNGDGDMDDANEALILDPQKLADHFGLPLKYLGKFDQGDFAKYSGQRYWVLVSWYNPTTKFTHWVVGQVRPVLVDTIRGGSRTVREGSPKPLIAGDGGIRVFEVRAA
jgi:hypothetical protein